VVANRRRFLRGLPSQNLIASGSVFAAGGEQYSLEHIAAMVLGHVKSSLADSPQEEVVDAVTAVPVFFSNSQR
jgi:molecular chaperone DnaK (HSP70)